MTAEMLARDGFARDLRFQTRNKMSDYTQNDYHKFIGAAADERYPNLVQGY